MTRRVLVRRTILGAVLLAIFLAAPTLGSAEDGKWFVRFERQIISPVDRADVTQLVDIGTIETDGFKELVFSLGGEFKQAVPETGRVGAILVPDHEIIQFLLRQEEVFGFPLEVVSTIPSDLTGTIFISKQQIARVAFPRYRVYLYNETDSAASVVLFVYRTR